MKIIPKKLSGEVDIPPSKSMSHRAIIAACLADGKSTVDNIILSNDIIATIDSMKSLGARIDIKDSGNFTKTNERKTLEIEGIQNCNDLKMKEIVLDCNESGSTLRFLIPIAALFDFKIIFTGKGKLPKRPLDVYYEIFDAQNLKYENTNGALPLTVDGRIKPGVFHVKGDISSQFISGLMFALPLLGETSEIIIDSHLESKGYVDMTISVLLDFGIKIINHDYKSFEIPGKQTYKPRFYTAEGDFSQAAFWIVANAMGSDIKINGLSEDSLQMDKKIIDIVDKLYDKNLIKIEDVFKRTDTNYNENQETKSDFKIDASDIPDIIPVICVMASVRNGITTIYNAARLRLKESDRIKAIVTELSKLGADIKEDGDSIIIIGKNHLKEGYTKSWDDHRIAMSMAIASTVCKGDVIINGYEAVKKSYPDFWKDFESLGGVIHECDDR